MKHNLASRSKPSSSASNGGPLVFQSDPSAGKNEEADYSAIKLECERALTAFQCGNHTEALRLIKEASQRHENHALVHRCQATIYAKVAEITDDQTAKQLYLKSGIDSARRACSLSPNSVEFAHFYANLLLEAAEYLEAIQECERALAIENPMDPVKESFQEDQKIPTAEGRIASVQQELKSLIQKANIASITAWIAKFGRQDGEEKFKLIPIRRPPESTKKLEERWKEIDVGVPAARVLQEKADSQVESNATDIDSDGAGDFTGNKLADILADFTRLSKKSSAGFSGGENGSSC